MANIKNKAWSSVNEALHLDSQGLEQAAYKKYLEGVNQLCLYLMEDANLLDLCSKANSSLQTLQILSLMKDSIERLIKLVTETEKMNRNVLGPEEPEEYISNSTDHLNQDLWSQRDFERKQRYELSPIEKAKRENQLIYRAYHARCQLLKDSSKKASMYLELHRRLNENIVVAKAKESDMRQKLIEKEKRTLELAARKLALKEADLDHVTSNTKEWEKLLLYAQIIQYEEKEDWPLAQRKRLKNDPDNDSLISDVVRRTLSTSNHPLTMWMCKYQGELIERIENHLKNNEQMIPSLPPLNTANEEVVTESEDKQVCLKTASLLPQLPETDRVQIPFDWNAMDVVSLFDPLSCRVNEITEDLIPSEDNETSLRTHLDEIVRETCDTIETLVQMMCATYELSGDASLEVCYAMVEACFFCNVWPKLLLFYRMVYSQSEEHLSSVMEHLSKSPPEELGVPPHFVNKSCIPEVMLRLKRITTLHTPLTKLNQIVCIAQLVCKSSQTQTKPLNADDLIGIVSFLLVQSGLPQLVSEFTAMEQIIPHRYLMGEEGYALTTHRTALKYLESQRDLQ